MYLRLFDADNNFEPVEVSVSLCSSYDIPESGRFVDSKGRTFNISTTTTYGIWKDTLIEGTGTEKIINLSDFESVMQEILGTFELNGTFLSMFHENPKSWTWTKSETSNVNPKITCTHQGTGGFNRIDCYLYPPAGTATNVQITDNNPPYPRDAGFLSLYTGDETDENAGWIFGYWKLEVITSGHALIHLVRTTSMNGDTWGKPIAEPGEQGFKPIGDHPIGKYIGGGTISGHTPKYQTDNISQPGAPDESAASAARLGFMRVYKVSEANLNRVGELLFNPLARLQLNFPSNPIDAIVSLNIFPCAPDVGGEVTIGAFGYNMASQVLGITAQGNPISNQFKTLDFGTVTVEEDWNSYLDYDATSVTLFLPFIGEVELPADEVIASSVNVQYTIDFFTGMCVANVLITKSVILASRRTVSHKTQHSYQGNCAINLPLTAVNYGTMIGSFVNAASSGLRTGMAGAVGSFASDVASGNFKPTITTKGTLSANAGYCGILYPYIIVTRPITTEPDAYQEVLGYPSYMENSIGACKGLCVCDDIKLNGITGATDSELSRIKQLCNEGVYN